MAFTAALALALPAEALALEPSYVVAGATRSAEGVFQTSDSSGCLVTYAQPRLFSTTPSGLSIHGPNAPHVDPHAAFADFTVIVVDVCENTTVSVAYGSGIVPGDAFSIQGNGLTSTTLVAPIAVCDRDLLTFECVPGSERNVLVDVEWTGVGPVGGYNAPPGMNLGPPFYIQIFRSTSRARFAEMSGSILDGTIDYTAGTTGQGVVSWFTATELQIILGPPN